MVENRNRTIDRAELRRRAEELARQRGTPSADEIALLPADEVARLLHELTVFGLERELQNDELRRLHADAEDTAARALDEVEASRRDIRTPLDTRIRAEQNLREREMLDRRIPDSIPAGIAHDFNNIVTIILGNTELMRDTLGDNPRATRVLDEIWKAGVRARELVKKILSSSERQPNQEKAAATAGDAGLAPSRTRGPVSGRILYIDDEEPLVMLVTRILARAGHVVKGFTDPREGLDALRAAPDAFDLVVSDYHMPRMSGLDVAKEVHTIRPGLEVAVVSGYVDEALREDAREAGVEHVIFKADAVEELCETVARLLGPAAR